MSLEYLQIPSGNTHYAYATGRIRGLEAHLLRDDDFARIREASGLREALEILSKTPSYADSMEKVEEEFESALEEEISKTYKELRGFCPEQDLVDLFWLEYDFHNLKVFLKAYLRGNISEKGMLQTEKDLLISGTQDPQALKEAVIAGGLADLSPELKSLLQESLSLLKSHPHLWELDCFLDRELFKWLAFKIRDYSDPFLDLLVQREIDYFNITTTLRIKFWRVKDEERFLKRALVDGGMISKERLLRLAGGSEGLLIKELKATDYGEAIEEALREEESSLFSLDKFFDEYILRYTRRGLYISFGREPLINYILLKKQEIRTLRGILRGKICA